MNFSQIIYYRNFNILNLILSYILILQTTVFYKKNYHQTLLEICTNIKPVKVNK